jgi:RNA polymerase sigma factor (sigma-70 family)
MTTTAATKIIKDIKNGDHEIISQFYKKYRAEFIFWAENRFSIDKDDAKDIFQDSLMDFYIAILDGKLTEINVNLKTYLFSCCKNKIYNLKKYKKKKVELETVSELSIIDNVLEESEFSSEVLNLAISKLPAKHQNILSLYYIKENCLEAIAQKLSYKNVNVTKKTKSASLKMLGNIIREVEYDITNPRIVGYKRAQLSKNLKISNF